MINSTKLYLDIIPILSICFVVVLIAYKAYFKIRSRFKILVNCWFCNANTKVPYLQWNSWWCPECEQYNGFTKDGDYNQEIISQLDCSINNGRQKLFTTNSYDVNQSIKTNGFCENCNENQRLKVEKLSQFEPNGEHTYQNEYNDFRCALEQQYRLCPTCERHLSKVLRDKKKMVLGSKLLDFIVRGADNLTGYPKTNMIKRANKSRIMTIISSMLLLLAIMNLFLIVNDLTKNTRKKVDHNTNNPVKHAASIVLAHILALIKVIQTSFYEIFQFEILQKLYLYVQTFLIFNEAWFKHFKDLFKLHIFMDIGIPIISIFLSFLHSLLDGFHLTRYTILLTLWSVYTGAFNSTVLADMDFLKLIIAIFAVILSFPEWNASEISRNCSENSFHKIYSDYLNEFDESSNLNNSVDSSRSISSSCTRKSISPQLRTSSALNLHDPISPFKRFTLNDDQMSSCSRRFNPMQQVQAHRSLFSSNMELNRPQSFRSVSNQSFCCSGDMNENMTTPGHENNDLWNRSLTNNKPLGSLNPSLCGSEILFRKSNQSFHDHSPNQFNSSFSSCNKSVFNDSIAHNRTTLLSPSRFSTTSSRFGTQPSWVSGGYFNSLKQNVNQSSIEPGNCFHSVVAPLTTENVSRASSQSSGFESHSSSNQNATLVGNNFTNGPMGRESSCCTDFDFQPICFSSNNIFQTPAPYHKNYDRFSESVFKPIHQPLPSSRLSMKSSFSTNNLNTFKSPAITYNCVDNNILDWRQKSNRDLSTVNSFNLKKINEELPLIQRGSLLKKFQEQQQQLACEKNPS